MRTSWKLTVVTLASLGLGVSLPAEEADFAYCESKLRTYSEWELGRGRQFMLELESSSGGALYLYGAEHSYSPAEFQNSYIEEAFGRFGPTRLYFEGHETGVGPSREQTIEDHGEPGLVRFLASAEGLPASTLEPEPYDEVSYLVERFGAEKVELFFVLRETVRLRERRGLSQEELHQAIARLQQSSTLPGSPGLIRSIDELEESFWKYWNYPHLWSGARPEWFNPYYESARTGGVFTNEIARASSEFRNRHMYRVLTEAVRDGHRVFAVVGRDHVPMQAPALRCALE